MGTHLPTSSHDPETDIEIIELLKNANITVNNELKLGIYPCKFATVTVHPVKSATKKASINKRMRRVLRY